MRPMQTSLLVAYLPFPRRADPVAARLLRYDWEDIAGVNRLPTARTGKTAYLLRGSCDRLAERSYTTILHIAV